MMIFSDAPGCGHQIDDGAAGPMAQVRGTNFADEILDGISSAFLLLYRTACQDAVQCSGHDAESPEPLFGVPGGGGSL